MAAIYGGDEVNAVVIDLGTCQCKAGYAGDDTPKAVFPSVVGVLPGADSSNGMDVDPPADANSSAAAEQQKAKQAKSPYRVGNAPINYALDHMKLVSPFDAEDLLSEWGLVEQLWSHALKDRLHVNPEEYAVLLAEPTHNSRAAREKAVELLFETFHVPAAFLAKDAVLSSFAVGKQTSLVVDAGYRSTTLAAVHDGYVLQKTVHRSPVAGALLNRCVLASLKAQGHEVRPRQAFKRVANALGDMVVSPLDTSQLDPSFLAYHAEAVAADIKEGLCRTSDNVFVPNDNKQMPSITYELPDGTEIQVGTDRFALPELLFRPREVLKVYPEVEAALGEETLKALRGWPGLVKHICENCCDVDIRKDMWNNVVLTGGTSLFTALRDRFEKSLGDIAPGGARPKVSAPINPTERRFSTWIGGSILASLGSFQQMWMSKQEYDEHGAALIHRKSP